MLDAVHEVRARNGERSAGRDDLQPRARGMNERGRARAIACLYAYEHVGDGRLQTDELDALAPEAARHGDDSPFDNRVGEFAQPRFDDGVHAVGELQNHRQALAGGDRRAPHDVVTIGQCLGQFKVRRTRFVRYRARVMSKDREHPRSPANRANHRKDRVRHSRCRFRVRRSRSGRNTRRLRADESRNAPSSPRTRAAAQRHAAHRSMPP